MLRLILLTLAAAFGIFAIRIINYKQTDFLGKTERIEILEVNPEFIQVLYSRSYMINRTSVAFNSTLKFIQNLGTDVVINVQAYKFASNEYRYFPLAFPVNLCRAIKEDIFGFKEIFKCGNFTECPFKIGTYTICKLSVDYSKFPPHIPFGRYLIDIKFIYHSFEILNGKLYVTIKDAKWENPV